MTAETAIIDPEAQIRALIEGRLKAIRSKDVNGAMSHISPDIVSFDVVNPLQYAGSDAWAKRAEQ